MASFFKKNKKKYAWEEPRFKGMVFHVKQTEDVQAVKDCVKGLAFDKWADKLRTTFNSDSVLRIRVEKGIFKKGDNAFVDRMVFNVDTIGRPIKNYPITDVYGKTLKKPENFEDVRGLPGGQRGAEQLHTASRPRGGSALLQRGGAHGGVHQQVSGQRTKRQLLRRAVHAQQHKARRAWPHRGRPDQGDRGRSL